MNPPGAARAGSKAGYAWAMKTGEHFGVSVLDRMSTVATKLGYPTRTDQWDGAQMEEVVKYTVAWIRTLDNYNGEFDAWAEANAGPYGLPDPAELGDGPSRVVQEQAAPAPQQAPPQQATPAPDSGLAMQRRAIMAAAEALVFKQAGRKATREELVAVISEAASASRNGQGVIGEVLESLGRCTDALWMRNVAKFLTEQIERTAQEATADATAGDDDIPF
jgi:hypothetical protein